MKTIYFTHFHALFLFSALACFGLFVFSSFESKNKKVRFEEIYVERINIIEKDGTVKLLLTNKERFPAGKEAVNGKNINENRPKFPGILFYNNQGIECGGLIYDGDKSQDGHSAGMSLTFDQFNSDQVIQLLYTDDKSKDRHSKATGLIFSDRRDDVDVYDITRTLAELRTLSDQQERGRRMNELQQNGFFGRRRIYLGRSDTKNNGLFLYDDQGKLRAMLYITTDNQPKLEFYDENGNITATFPNNR
jgi:hypothetical protein